jgi:hypothetical protein
MVCLLCELVCHECGYIDSGVIPKFAGCVNGVQWFKERGQWQDRNFEPSAGQNIFYDWDDENGQDGEADHVGIVERVENGIVYTIEGNSGDAADSGNMLLDIKKSSVTVVLPIRKTDSTFSCLYIKEMNTKGLREIVLRY